MSKADFDLEKLKNLLERRDVYFNLDSKMRKDYQPQFEKMQKDIIGLKLRLELYHDELDLFQVNFSYIGADAKDKMDIMQTAHDNKEIRWLRKTYNPNEGTAIYIGQIRDDGVITDSWLQDKFLEHRMKREGYIDCPWPTKLS